MKIQEHSSEMSHIFHGRGSAADVTDAAAQLSAFSWISTKFEEGRNKPFQMCVAIRNGSPFSHKEVIWKMRSFTVHL